MSTEEKQTIDVVKKVSPAVVSIVVSKYMPKIKHMSVSPFGDMPFGFGIPPEMPDAGNGMDSIIGHGNSNGQKVKVGGGSGSIVSSDGLILTNKHVVFDTNADYTVITNDDKEYPAKVLSRDPVNDVAFVKIEATGLPTAELGKSKDIVLGQTVLAIGNALGIFSNSVSKGIISGLGRKISASMGGGEGEMGNGDGQMPQMESLRNVIQTDVAINQGNSGGPLVNLNGEVIGINTAVIFGAQNIGFALPIDWAKTDLADFKKHGRIIRPYIGLRYIMLNKELKSMYKLPADYGALVVRDHVPGSVAVVPDSPADKAGVKENDIILAVNGKKLDEKNEISDIVQTAKVGDELEMEVMRKNKTIKVTAKLEEHA
ncbi:MAG: trypsin-like peptidase domain-containing protein [bacterium]|nr:trypsin-like peptidase domain-containing protein [bacterium]